MTDRLKVSVVVLNWNGKQDTLNCIKSIKHQSARHQLIVVDNNSDEDISKEAYKLDKDLIFIRNTKNLGFSGGVNTGIRKAIERGSEYIALINNDAIADKDWLKVLLKGARRDNTAGIVTGKLLKMDGSIDSTGDIYTSWGLPHPRGRNEQDEGQYDKGEYVFGATGGASLYRSSMLREIGLFDEDFFAYYEDVDISFRAQLADWKILYTPQAVAHHKVGASSSKVSGLTTYMTIKNYPWLLWKNVPLRLLPTIWPRFFVAHSAVIASSLAKGKIVPVFRGIVVAFLLFPKKLVQRRRIQKNKKVSTDYIRSIIFYDLPPNAKRLRRIRSYFRT